MQKFRIVWKLKALSRLWSLNVSLTWRLPIWTILTHTLILVRSVDFHFWSNSLSLTLKSQKSENISLTNRNYWTSCSVLFDLLSQVVISSVCECFATSRAKPELLIPSKRINSLGIFCEIGMGFTIATIYNLIIIIGCCYYAFRARKVPSNFNESKFIAVSVYSTLVVVLAAIPVHNTSNTVEGRIATFSVVLLLNTILTLACLYLPKLYAVHFAQEMNWNIWRVQHFQEAQPNAPAMGRINVGYTGTPLGTPQIARRDVHISSADSTMPSIPHESFDTHL